MPAATIEWNNIKCAYAVKELLYGFYVTLNIIVVHGCAHRTRDCHSVSIAWASAQHLSESYQIPKKTLRKLPIIARYLPLVLYYIQAHMCTH